jgi:hypothetical protein
MNPSQHPKITSKNDLAVGSLSGTVRLQIGLLHLVRDFLGRGYLARFLDRLIRDICMLDETFEPHRLGAKDIRTSRIS